MKESNSENCKDTVIATLASAGIKLVSSDIATAHRIFSSTSPRPIIVQFLYPDQKQQALQARTKVKETSKVTIVDDIPDEIREAKKILFPIMYKEKAEYGDTRARIRGNKLILNGSYEFCKNFAK